MPEDNQIKLKGLKAKTDGLAKTDSPHLANRDFEAKEKNWAEVRLGGKAPDRRGYHNSFLYKGKFYIHGGHDIREGSFDSLWELDLQALQRLEKSLH